MIKRLLPFLLIGFVKLLQWTCRVRARNDPRPRLRREGSSYIFAALHAHQIPSVIYSEPGTGALVSKSADGELVARVLLTTGVIPIRGSGGARRKGGAAGLRALVNHVRGGKPAYLAVDGPKGPRGKVHPGAAMLSQKTQVPVVPLTLVARRRLILRRCWDRTQIPLPGSRIDVTFGDPIFPRPGESVEQLTDRIEAALNALERQIDPAEAARETPEPRRAAA